MRTQWIEVDEEVLARIKANAEPFVDSPNDVLRCLCGLEARERPSCSPLPADAPKGLGPGRRRARSGELLALQEYYAPLLQALAELGGEATKPEVVDRVERLIGDRLTELDRGHLQSGEVRWVNRLSFVRLRAIDRNHMLANTPRGIWALSEAGAQELARLREAEGREDREAAR